MNKDVIIIGAGLSGIGATCHFKRDNPEKSYLILESREEFGGTWSLFKYPGIGSDSDLYHLLDKYTVIMRILELCQNR